MDSIGDYDSDDDNFPLSRRTALKGGAVAALGLGGAATATLYGSSGPSLAVEVDNAWLVEDANIETDDGSIEEMTIGDGGNDGDGIALTWEGLNEENRLVSISIGVRGSDEDFEDDGTDSHEYESILSGSVIVEETSGDESYNWIDVFDEDDIPMSIFEHSALDTSQFEAEDDGTVRERTLELEIVAEFQEEDAIDTAEDTASIEVQNIDADAAVGGEGEIDIEG